MTLRREKRREGVLSRGVAGWTKRLVELVNGGAEKKSHLSDPFQTHSNLSKMQSFSYKEHSLPRK